MATLIHEVRSFVIYRKLYDLVVVCLFLKKWFRDWFRYFLYWYIHFSFTLFQRISISQVPFLFVASHLSLYWTFALRFVILLFLEFIIVLFELTLSSTFFFKSWPIFLETYLTLLPSYSSVYFFGWALLSNICITTTFPRYRNLRKLFFVGNYIRGVLNSTLGSFEQK